MHWVGLGYQVVQTPVLAWDVPGGLVHDLFIQPGLGWKGVDFGLN
jgi:hypothetical protein